MKIQRPNIFHFKAFGMMNLHYEVRIYQKIDNRVTITVYVKGVVWFNVNKTLAGYLFWFLGLKLITSKCSTNKILAAKNLGNSVHTSVFGVFGHWWHLWHPHGCPSGCIVQYWKRLYVVQAKKLPEERLRPTKGKNQRQQSAVFLGFTFHSVIN